MDGIFNIYKQKGFTSHDVVAIVRKTIQQKKVGHTGTLDPDAEGVLPICVGKATKLADYIMEGKKGYRAVVTLGTSTTTEDASGEIIEKKEFILKKEIDWVKDAYDFIIIDCPPSLSMLTVNAMTTADAVLVPIQCEYYALEGLSQLIHTVNLVKERLNPVLDMEGIVFTMYDSRTNLSNQVVENVKNNLEKSINVYKTIIPRNIRLAEAPSHGIPIQIYDPKSAGAESYRSLAKEIIGRKNRR